MTLELTIPARINILGNPSDGNEGDFATISAAVNIFAGAVVEDASSIQLRVLASKPNDLSSPATVLDQVEYSPSQIPFPYDGRINLQKAAFNRLYQFSKEFRTKVHQKGVRISYWSEVPRQSGLGGSSLFVLLTLAH